jgi:hypothetical protein
MLLHNKLAPIFPSLGGGEGMLNLLLKINLFTISQKVWGRI